MNHSVPNLYESKSPEHALAARLIRDAGLNLAQARVVVEAVSDYIQDYFSDTRPPGTVIHTAVAATEPAGKPIKHCEVVPVRLTFFDAADFEVFAEKGSVVLRELRLYRLSCEAREQGGLLSQEDLSGLLCVNPSTVRDLVARLRAQGLYPPTRGAICDIGPEPSHKRRIAELLGRGWTTSEVRSATRHSESSIARYQRDFGLVLYLLARYPEALEEDLWRASGLGRKAYAVYVEVARTLAEDEGCRPHLERLRRRYEIDPNGVTREIPTGKRRVDRTGQRLQQQTLANVVRQTLQEDLGTTRRVAEAVTGDLLEVLERSFSMPDELRPGELVIYADAADPISLIGQRATDRKVVPVRVPLATEEIKAIWRRDEPLTRRRARIAVLIATAAQEQGAVMTVAALAELLHVSPSVMGRDLRDLAITVHVEAPTKGLIEDAGPTLTHKDWIVDLDHHGLTGEEITWLTRHAPASRDRYIETYRRAETLMRLEDRIPSAEELARVLRLRVHVAREYVELLERYHGPGEDIRENAPTAASTCREPAQAQCSRAPCTP